MTPSDFTAVNVHHDDFDESYPEEILKMILMIHLLLAPH